MNVVDAFCNLSDDAVIFEPELAKAFGKCRMTIKRSVERGELPGPFRMMGKNAWTVRMIRAHFGKLEAAARTEAARVQRLSACG